MTNIIYEINTAAWLPEQGWAKNGMANLADIPDSQIREWMELGIDTVWFLGVWRRGEASRRICLEEPGLCEGFESASPGSVPDHVIGSPFSIADYSISPRFGDESTLPLLREKLHAHGIRLMLDFVPNHLAVDHPWVQEHPERLVCGSEVFLSREPCNYFRVPGHPERILAQGRDPYFAGWTDTVQINIFSREARKALTDTLLCLAEVCDSVRCDMAMLVTNDVFRQTWGDLSPLDYPSGDTPEFWVEAIRAVKDRHPDFLFAAEVYWGLEPQLQQMGFDLTYDKDLYDSLHAGDASGIRKIFFESQVAPEKMIHFIENHDETRAAKAFGIRQPAAAVALSGLPGQVLFHEGQFDGRHVHAPVQIDIQKEEPKDKRLHRFYRQLLEVMREPVMRVGRFIPLAIHEAWQDNASFHGIITYWCTMGDEHRLIVANIGGHRAQAYTDIPLDMLQGAVLEFRDLLSEAVYHRSIDELVDKGLYLDLPLGAYHIFAVHA